MNLGPVLTAAHALMKSLDSSAFVPLNSPDGLANSICAKSIAPRSRTRGHHVRTPSFAPRTSRTVFVTNSATSEVVCSTDTIASGAIRPKVSPNDVMNSTIHTVWPITETDTVIRAVIMKSAVGMAVIATVSQPSFGPREA